MWDALRRGLTVCWPYLVYYAAYFAALAYFVVTACLSWWSLWQISILVSALAWGFLICLCIWPPLETLFPKWVGLGCKVFTAGCGALQLPHSLQMVSSRGPGASCARVIPSLGDLCSASAWLCD